MNATKTTKTANAKLCGLCGEPMGFECGAVHFACACEEQFIADQMPSADLDTEPTDAN